MKLETLNEIEKSIGGRPKSANPKVRLSFYLSPCEAEQLKMYVVKSDSTVSEIVRRLIRSLINSHTGK